LAEANVQIAALRRIRPKLPWLSAASLNLLVPLLVSPAVDPQPELAWHAPVVARTV
jgi:hypothetical protein